MEKVLLIDGDNLASRVYFTNNTYNVVNILNHVTRAYSVKNVVFFWDSPCDYRKTRYPEYKGNRKEDPKRSGYVTTISKIVEESGHSSIAVEGYEADDLLYTAVMDLDILLYDPYVLSSDRDLLGLVQYGAKVVLPKNRGKFELFDELPHTYDYYEWKALVGDTSDNLPGAKGIGTVRANKLLEKYGNLGTLLESDEKRIVTQKSRIELMHDLVSPLYCEGLMLNYREYDANELRSTIKQYIKT